MLGLLAHILLWVLAGIGILTVIFVATELLRDEAPATVPPKPLPSDPDRIWQLFPEDPEYDATVRQLRRLERDAMQRLEDLRTGRP